MPLNFLPAQSSMKKEQPCDRMLHLDYEWCTKQALDYIFWLVPEDSSTFLSGGTSSSEGSSTMMNEQ